VIALLLRLYPAAWRRRYGDEFAAVLEERPLGPFDVADVLLGALDAHLHRRGLWTESGPRKGLVMTLRIGGLAAVLFGLVWALGIAWASSSDTDDDIVAVALTIIGEVSLIIALIGLSAFQARQHHRLVWASVLLPVAGAVVTIVGTVGMQIRGDGAWIAGMSPWEVFVAGLLGMAIGSLLFAMATWSTKSLAPRAAALIGVGAVWVLVAGFIHELALLAGLIVFSIGWIWLGVDAIRRDRPVVALAP
jgi:hypothetical protein